MKSERLILFFVIITIIFVYINSRKAAEHLDTTTTPILSNEAIQSISSVYTSSTGTASFNNINVTAWRGMIVMWSGDLTKIPQGWALCDGSNNTPDLRGKFILGYGQGKDASGANLTNRQMNEQGGEERHKLDVTEMPSHNHVHRHYVCSGGNCNSSAGYQDSGDYSSRTTTNNAGGDASGNTIPHNNMPPYYVLAYIMKI